MKRIAFVISSQHLIVHGGIGQFFKGFYEQICKPNGYVLDIILDQAPAQGILDATGFDGKLYYPSAATMAKYTKHNSIFSFDDSVNLEKAINFRDSMFSACKENIYDLIIINSIDAVTGIYCLGLHRFVPVVMYTHLAMMLGNFDVKHTAFSPEFLNYFVANSKLLGLIVGTQTEVNAGKIREVFGGNPVVLPMPIPELGLLEEYTGDREGVLFIGRYESGKNPSTYVEAVVKTGLKAKVITNANGAKKFKRDFEDLKYDNYEIKVGVVGKEKVDFIKSAKVYFNPSLIESFGFTMLEGLSQLHTVVLDGKDWPDVFLDLGFEFHRVSAKDAPELIKALHEEEISVRNLDTAIYYNENAISHWKAFIENYPLQAPTVCKFTSVSGDFYWADYLNQLGRTISIEDIQNGYRNRGHYDRKNTSKGTWCSLNGSEPPEEFDLEAFA